MKPSRVHTILLPRSSQVTLLRYLLALYRGRVHTASCWSVSWQPQIFLNTPFIHLSLFLHDTEWVWQALGCPSLALVAQFCAIRIIASTLLSCSPLISPTHSPHHPASCEHMFGSITCPLLPMSLHHFHLVTQHDPASNMPMLAGMPKQDLTSAWVSCSRQHPGTQQRGKI